MHPMATKLVQRSVTFTQPQYRWLKAESARLGITIATLVQRIIDAARETKPAKEAVQK